MIDKPQARNAIDSRDKKQGSWPVLESVLGKDFVNNLVSLPHRVPPLSVLSNGVIGTLSS
ncbi:MAG: hypothetical protein ACRC8Y_24350 [Chroococcales cyanobacterium]